MLTEGMYIADRYEIIGKIGAGGMSDVYKAKDARTFCGNQGFKAGVFGGSEFCDKVPH